MTENLQYVSALGEDGKICLSSSSHLSQIHTHTHTFTLSHFFIILCVTEEKFVTKDENNHTGRSEYVLNTFYSGMGFSSQRGYAGRKSL